jgi:DNA-binding NarL/FixJ family response regulator
VVSAQVQTRSPANALQPLASREREVLRRIAEGQITKQIAAELGIGSKTVETYRRRIMKKLNAYTVADLTKHAIRQGLATLEVSA